ncbi:hypothetical protein ACLOJK_039459 [Asimina triloba]
MLTDMLLNALLVLVSEILSTIIKRIFETIVVAKDVLFEKESFEKLASYLERIIPVLRELIKKNVRSSESLNNVTKRNKIYLIVNCRKIAKRLQQTTREISRATSLILCASLDLSSSINEEGSATVLMLSFGLIIGKDGGVRDYGVAHLGRSYSGESKIGREKSGERESGRKIEGEGERDQVKAM